MTVFPRAFRWPQVLTFFLVLLGGFSCASNEPGPAAATPPKPAAPPVPRVETVFPVMLGIDVLASENFAPIAGKRVGLLTHPAGVNRQGVSTIDVLRHAPNVKLVALYGMEHGVYNEFPAQKPYPDHLDPRTGLTVYSLYNSKSNKPQPYQLKPIDVLVIDLQDIGTRSYTFISAMKVAMEACFENGVEVVVLDRPNPLGGLKVDGPLLDPQLVGSYVGEFRVPYVHGLTIGELALMAKEAPGVLRVSEAVRARGKLTIVPMRGWRRAMRWPETGLKFVPTSPYVQDFAACVGYAMVGLGTYFDPASHFDIGFRHGLGNQYPFRGISHVAMKSDVLERELNALHLPGLDFRLVSAPDKNGKPTTGVYAEVTDWNDWQPTELNFYLMRMACKLGPRNPFLTGDASGFLHHMGSTAFLEALRRDGAKVNLEAFLADWRAHDAIYQEQSRRYWLYH
ncbi:MAG TPA: DUF1343 domain-containing protein [Opitutaceae bacterium]|nr:DUF1343 domain-containing protein [Opitutaceae bacterium]